MSESTDRPSSRNRSVAFVCCCSSSWKNCCCTSGTFDCVSIVRKSCRSCPLPSVSTRWLASKAAYNTVPVRVKEPNRSNGVILLIILATPYRIGWRSVTRQRQLHLTQQRLQSQRAYHQSGEIKQDELSPACRVVHQMHRETQKRLRGDAIAAQRDSTAEETTPENRTG